MHLSRWSLILASCCGFAALTLLHAALNANEQPAKPDQPFHAQLLDIAKQYKATPFFVPVVPVDGHVPHWAPALCRLPVAGKDFMPSKPRTSDSKDADTHGQKLYFLYAKDQAAYLDLGEKPMPVGQVLVKESWLQEEYREPPIPVLPGISSPEPFAVKDGKKYKPGKLAGLYVMFKTEAKTPGTDDGWVYGTITADGKQVTAAGRVESCMSCHEKAKHDRLFGLPKEDVQRIKTFIEKTKQLR